MALASDLFRSLRGAFPAGVTVVTTLDAEGAPRGFTSTAFCSVSADPPLFLICVMKSSTTLAALRTSGAFVVNFLAAGREQVSRRFATKDPDKFARVRWRPSSAARGAPMLVDDSVACAECVVERSIETGDHWVFIGRVEGGLVLGGRPLMFLRRSYRAWPEPIASAAS